MTDEQAVAEVERQRARIAEIRTNAGVVIAGVTLVASFLGAKAIEVKPGHKGLTDAALVLLAISIFLTSRALWPVRDKSAKGCPELVASKVGGKRLVKLTGFGSCWRHVLPPDHTQEQLESTSTRIKSCWTGEPSP